MADSTYSFRSALGGFNKGDVTRYIEKTASEHRSALLSYEQTIAALREENRSLQQQLNLLMMSSSFSSHPAPAPVPQAASVSEPAPVIEPVPAPEPVVDSAPEPSSPEQDPTELMTKELQAYRRAEAVERKANQRARNLSHQIELVCTDALDEFQATDSAVKQTLGIILAQAESLEQAYRTLSDALRASREKLASLNEDEDSDD